MILLDTSVLIDSLTADRILFPQLRAVMASGELVRIPTLVMYEWLRGPRTADEVTDLKELFPAADIIVFGVDEAALSANLYRTVRRARSREIDIAIAACAIQQNAELWTLNRADFVDIPGLRLFHAKA
jgi:predicted nucleic acid-binding protein